MISEERPMTLEDKKKVVLDFFKTAFEDKDPEKALRLYVGDYYRQHNPTVPDGKEAFAAYVKMSFSEESGSKNASQTGDCRRRSRRAAFSQYFCAR